MNIHDARRWGYPLILLAAGILFGYFFLGQLPVGRAAPPAPPLLQPVCGDDRCDGPDEHYGNCPADCPPPDDDPQPPPSGSCDNDGICEPPDEATFNCGDCLSVCGDNICAPSEVDSCCGTGGDCTVAITCGDGICSACENADNCATDCEATAVIPISPLTDTATPEEEETDEPEVTEEPDEEDDLPPEDDTPTPQTMADTQEPMSDEGECRTFFGREVCIGSITFFGATIICCMAGGAVLGGAVYAASNTGSGTSGTGGPQPDIHPPAEGTSLAPAQSPESVPPDPTQPPDQIQPSDSTAPPEPIHPLDPTHPPDLIQSGDSAAQTVIDDSVPPPDPGLVGGFLLSKDDEEEEEGDDQT